MADKVSLRSHCRGLLRYCTQVTARQYLFAVVYSFTFSRLSSVTHTAFYFKPFTHFLYRHEARLYHRGWRLRLSETLRDIRNSLKCSFNKYLKRQLIKITARLIQDKHAWEWHDEPMNSSSGSHRKTPTTYLCPAHSRIPLPDEVSYKSRRSRRLSRNKKFHQR
jgi:hypothetical protein